MNDILFRETISVTYFGIRSTLVTGEGIVLVLLLLLNILKA
jgi:hypothetical protein